MTNYSYSDDPVRIMKAAAESQIASLKAALREALDTWELFTSVHDKVGRQRIAALRAQFLDDK